MDAPTFTATCHTNGCPDAEQPTPMTGWFEADQDGVYGPAVGACPGCRTPIYDLARP